jgi:LCP family protein required for cell wall assembly
MGPAARREAILYSLIALFTLILVGILLVFVITRVGERGQLQQTVVAAQGTATALRTLQADLFVPTGEAVTPTAPGIVLPPSWTPLPSAMPSATRTSPPTATFTPTPSDTPTATRTPGITLTFTPTFTPPRGAPPRVEPVDPGEYDLFNILLVGSDRRPNMPNYRTDTLVIVSVNRTTNTVNLMSIPRDLYIYIPTVGYDRVNTAAYIGETINWPGGGDALLAEAVAYNTGVRIDRFAHIEFNAFKTIIDGLGGIDVAVDCPLTDYRIAGPDLDPEDLDNYRWYTLPVGLHHMDGSLALWFSRSRQTTSDFERNRRQQLILRAIWGRVKEMGMVSQIPMLWEQVTGLVATNLTLSDVVGLAPVALALDGSRMRSYFLGPEQVAPRTTEAGASVLMPRPDKVRRIVELLYTPPTSNALFAESPSLEVYNGTENGDWDRVAVSRLGWEGFTPVDAGLAAETDYSDTLIYDYTGGAKPGSLDALMRALNAKEENVINAPDPNQIYDFRVILGASYNACTYSAWRAMAQD